MYGNARNRIIFALALLGCGVALFLTVEYVRNAVSDIPCGYEGGCEAVAEDYAAHGLGIPGLQSIPTPAFGLVMYLTLAGLSMIRVVKPAPSVVAAASRFQWLIATGGVVVSGWLTWREAYRIHNWCTWCIGQAIIVTLIFLTTASERLYRPRSLSPR